MKITRITDNGERQCSVCGKIAELRPYGKNGAWVCFECGMKDEEEATRQFAKLIEGDDITILG